MNGEEKMIQLLEKFHDMVHRGEDTHELELEIDHLSGVIWGVAPKHPLRRALDWAARELWYVSAISGMALGAALLFGGV